MPTCAEFIRRLLRNSGDWVPLEQRHGCSGSLAVFEPRVFGGPDACRAIAKQSLTRLFDGRSDIDAFRRAPVSKLTHILRQFAQLGPFAEDDSAVIIHASDRSVRLLKHDCGPNEQVRVTHHVQQTLQGDKGAYFDPALPMLDTGHPLKLQICKYRLSHPNPRARPCRIHSEDRATVGNSSYFQATQYLYTLADGSPQDRVALRAAVAPAHLAQRELLPDGTLSAVYFPTLMVHRLTRYGSMEKYTSMRFGINFSPGGEHICGLSTKLGDFEAFLRYFPPAFKYALDSLYRGG